MTSRFPFLAAALLTLAALPGRAADELASRRWVADVHGSLLGANPALKKVTQASTGGALGVSLAYRLLPDQEYYTRLSLSFLSMPGKHQNASSPNGTFLQDRAPNGSFLRAKAGTTSTWELVQTDPALAQGTKTSLSDLQLALDLVFPVLTRNMKAFVGLTGNRYHVKNTGVESYWFATDAASSYPAPFNGMIMPLNVHAVKNDKGIKGGIRAGLQYDFNAHWSADLTLQVTELGPGVVVPTSTLPSGNTNSRKTPYNEVNRGPVDPSWFQFGARYRF